MRYATESVETRANREFDRMLKDPVFLHYGGHEEQRAAYVAHRVLELTRGPTPREVSDGRVSRALAR